MVCRESVLNFLSRVPSWFSWSSAIVPLLVFCWSKSFSRGYFVDLIFFLVGISCVRKSWVFRGSGIFSLWYFVSPIFFRMANFVIQKFSAAGYTRKSDENINTESYLKPNDLNRFQQLSIVYIRKMLHLLNQLRYSTAFIRTNCIFRRLFLSVLRSRRF